MPSYTLKDPNSVAIPTSTLIHQSVWVIFMILFSFHPSYGQHKNFSINKKKPDWKVNLQIKNERLATRDISDGYYLSFYGNQNHLGKQEDYPHIIKEIASEAGVQVASDTNLITNKSRKIFHKNFNFQDAPKIRSSGDLNIYEWEATMTKMHRVLDYEPHWYRIIILYLRKSDRVCRTFIFTYPKSSWESEVYAYHDNYFKNYHTKTQQSTYNSADSVDLRQNSNPVNKEEI